MLGVPSVLELGRIEDTEVLTDDLVCGVALDPLSSRVPAHDVAFRREHEDRVVLDRLDEQPEPVLALPELGLGGSRGCDVLYLKKDVQRTAARVPHRRQRGHDLASVRWAGTWCSTCTTSLPRRWMSSKAMATAASRPSVRSA